MFKVLCFQAGGYRRRLFEIRRLIFFNTALLFEIRRLIFFNRALLFEIGCLIFFNTALLFEIGRLIFFNRALLFEIGCLIFFNTALLFWIRRLIFFNRALLFEIGRLIFFNRALLFGIRRLIFFSRYLKMIIENQVDLYYTIHMLRKAKQHREFVEKLLFTGVKQKFLINDEKIKFLHSHGLIKKGEDGYIEFWVPMYKKAL